MNFYAVLVFESPIQGSTSSWIFLILNFLEVSSILYAAQAFCLKLSKGWLEANGKDQHIASYD